MNRKRTVSLISLLVIVSMLLPTAGAAAAPGGVPGAPAELGAGGGASPLAGSGAGEAGACSLAPIALSAAALDGKLPGDPVSDILNGDQPGNFGWLSWSGDPGDPALVTSLTPPGDSHTYVNPSDPADHLVNLGDWIQGRPGVRNSGAVRQALDLLKALDITVPVWDASAPQGTHAAYRVVGFVVVRLVGYWLPRQNRIAVTYLGYDPACPGQGLPEAHDDEYTVDQDQVLSVPAPGVLANDTDADGDPLSARLGEAPAHGALVLNPDGSLSYTPEPGFFGPDQFSYVANDGRFDSAPATVQIAVLPGGANEPPAAADDAYTLDEDGSLSVPAPGVLGNDLDPDGDALTAALVAGPEHGALQLEADGSFTYTPDPGYNGMDGFSYQACDAAAACDTAAVAITVAPVNDPPAALDDAYGVDAGQVLDVPAPGVLANDGDPDGDPLSAVLDAGPSHGTLALAADGSFSYTPAPGFSGPDSFSYHATDGGLSSNLATVSIQITPPNYPPAAVDDAYSVLEDTVLAIAAPGVLGNDSDPEGDPLTAVLAGDVSSGVLVLNADGSFGYTPAAGFSGTDSFTYRAGDGESTSGIAQVTIEVIAVNQPPVALDDAYTFVQAPLGPFTIELKSDGTAAAASLGSGVPSGALMERLDTPDLAGLSFQPALVGPFGTFTPVPPGAPAGTEVINLPPGDGQSGYFRMTFDLPPGFQEASLFGAANADDLGRVFLNGHALSPSMLQNVLPRITQYGNTTFSTSEAAHFKPGLNEILLSNANSGGGPSGAAFYVQISYRFGTHTVGAPGVLGNDADPDGDPLAAVWLAGPAHGTVTLNADGSFGYTPDPGFIGTDSFTYRVSDGSLDSNPATVSLTLDPPNRAPVAVNDGFSVEVGRVLEVVAPGVLGNDGDPDGDPLIAVLDADVAHGMLALATDGSFSYTPAPGFSGTDSFSYHAWDGDLASDAASVTLLVGQANTPPVAHDDLLTTAEDTPATVDVAANDVDTDGNLDPATVVATSLPTHGALANNGDGTFDYTPDPDYGGADGFGYQVCDTGGACAAAAVSITVTPVNDAPVALDDAASTNADQGLDVPAPGVLGNDGDADGDPLTALLDAGASHGTVTLNADGSFSYTPSTGYLGADSFIYHASDGTLDSGLATVTIGVMGAPPVASLSSPADGSEVTAPTQIAGTADSPILAGWTLEARSARGVSWVALASGSAPVLDGVLGTLDPTLLLNGLYEVRLTATDTSGQSSAASISLVVEGEQKVGSFRISFLDLEIPMPGMSLQIVRTYDSRDKRSGDFGVGWTLDIRSTRVQEDGAAGAGWEGTVSGGFLKTYCIVPTKSHRVTITLPDGSVFKFQPVPEPQCQAITPPQWVSMSYAALPGTHGTLVALGGTDLFADGFWPGPIELLDAGTFELYDPGAYQLTTQDGRVLVIDQQAGLQSMTDANGNTLTITGAGISHSSGKSVAFARDAQGRITQVSDPAGYTLGYGYDAQGDLVSVTDQAGQVTSFSYNSAHGLLDVVDPRGVRAARSEYDDAGRLVAHIDADGNRVEYAHDLGTRQEAVTDRLGHLTVYEYDEAGYVTRKTDPLGNVTTYSYDANGNKLGETDALGHTTTFSYDAQDNLVSRTDPLGHTTSYTYNSRGQVLTTTDPLGNVTTNAYDADGNLVSVTDAGGYVTLYTYDPAGNRASMTDGLGHTTAYAYDAAGQMVSQTDPLGHTTTYTYDANGNLLSETESRTTPGGVQALTTSYAYDAKNRLVQTIDPLGGIETVEYNAIGKKAAAVDKLGRRTEYQYDAAGNLVATLYADGTQESATYDAEGHKLTRTDRAGRTTAYQYDGAGRRIRTTYPDGTLTQDQVDAVGQVIQSLDERGNATQYAYDAAGRRTSVTDALGHTSSYTYDAAGNMAGWTDALGHTTQYESDALGRRVRTLFADGSEEGATYDALGHRTGEVDQAGRATGFGYDALGRLSQVTDALGNTTLYAYDELGSLVAHTDANGHATLFEYDGLGRRTKRTLPLGMAETWTYDAAGNVTAHTDMNGQATTFAYDADNRLSAKQLPGGGAESYTYSPTGLRLTANDARGVTSYAYDARDRLTLRTDPDGRTVAYAYDAAGNRLSVATASGTTAYTYDALNRLATAADVGFGVTAYTYDAAGNRSSVAYPNGTAATYTYDALNRLTALVNAKSGGAVISSYVYTLGPTGVRTRVVEHSGRSVDYSYDAVYRLTQEAIDDPVSGARTLAYSYDAVGNRLTKVDGGVTTQYGYDANDRLLTEGGTSYTYDDNGNTLTRTGAAQNASYSYDTQDRLVQAQVGASTLSYTYDVDGNRVRKVVDGSAVTDYLVDGNRDLAQVLEERDGAGALVVRYLYGDDLIGQRRAAGNRTYHADGQASTRQLSDASETVTDAYDYDAFGQLLSQSGTTANDYRFGGEQYDANAGFYYLRARLYNPALGRFLTVDPYEGSRYDPVSLHRYLYCADDPVNLSDPSGRFFSMIDISISLSLQSMQTSYNYAVLKTGLSAIKVADTILLPAYALQGVVLGLITDGVDTPGVLAMLDASQEMIAAGYRTMAVKIAEGMTDWARSLIVPLSLKFQPQGVELLEFDLASILTKPTEWTSYVPTISALDSLKKIAGATAGFLSEVGENPTNADVSYALGTALLTLMEGLF